MINVSAKLYDIISPPILALGYELVGCVQFRQGKRLIIRIYIDSNTGITLEDCERVSHQVSGVLAVADPIPGDYSLEVSSPGLERPLFTLEHFERFTGNRVRLRLRVPLNQRRNYIGVLNGVDKNNVLLKLENEEVALPFSNIERANLVPHGES